MVQVNLALELFLLSGFRFILSKCQEQSQLTCGETCLILYTVVSFVVGVQKL